MRITSVIALSAGTLLLAGCNTNKDNDGVRGGPQAVHPSTSALAQGTSAAPVPVQTAPAYTPVAGDGSQPIID